MFEPDTINFHCFTNLLVNTPSSSSPWPLPVFVHISKQPVSTEFSSKTRMYLLTILVSLLLHACYANAQSFVSDRFCPWCYWSVPDSMAGLPEFRFDSFCHAFVHQPISDRPGPGPSPPQKPAIHVAIMNNNFTELLSYSRMGYGMSVDLPTRPTRCAPGVATFHMGGREDQQGGDGSLRP